MDKTKLDRTTLTPGSPSVPRHPTFREAFRFWLKLGFISFGGPAGQISIMHHELVDRKKWISNERFLNALNYCMLLPGPEAQQLATYIGWLLHKIPGGFVAGALFVLPSVFILLALSYIYAAFGAIPWVASIFNGLKAAIMAVVVSAVIKIGKKALKNEIMVGLAAVSLLSIHISGWPLHRKISQKCETFVDPLKHHRRCGRCCAQLGGLVWYTSAFSNRRRN